MAYLKKSSFSFGELDPALHDKTDTKSYFSGLAVARNVLIGKTGSILNASGTWMLAKTKTDGDNVRIYIPENVDLLYEFGVGYVRTYLLNVIRNEVYVAATHSAETTTSYTLSDLPKLNFQTVRYTTWDSFLSRYFNTICIYVSCEGKPIRSFKQQLSVIYNDYIKAFDIPHITATAAIKCRYAVSSATMNAMIGHKVQYAITAVSMDDQESLPYEILTYRSTDNIDSAFTKLPTGTELMDFIFEDFSCSLMTTYSARIKKFRIYRRPYSSSAFGFIGEVSNLNASGNPIDLSGLPPSFTFDATFTDFGQEADYTNTPPSFSSNYVNFTTLTGVGATGDVALDTGLKCQKLYKYNSRLVMVVDDLIIFSRVQATNNFVRDFPLSAVTGLNLKIGTDGHKILHVLDYSGLFIFTANGVWYGGSDSPVSATEPIIKKIGDWIADETVPPISTPYGVLFVDKSTGSVKTISYDDNSRSVDAEDVSLYSNHLFYGKSVINWVYVKGDIPYLFVVLSDGTALTLNYNKNEKMMAWTRHDTDGLYEDCTSYRDTVTGKFYLFTIVNRNGKRYIEHFGDRVRRTKLQDFTFAHSAIYKKIRETVQPTVTLNLNGGTWSDSLISTVSITSYYTTRVNKYFRMYNSSTGQSIMLQLTAATLGVSAIFLPSSELPTWARSTSVEIFECHDTVTGLTHLEGKEVSVVCDNAVVSSPYNTKDALTTLTVTGGTITLPSPSCETVVGLPYISDIETLGIDNQEGTIGLDRKLVNRIAIRYSRTRGGFISGYLPTTNTVDDMEDAESWTTIDYVNQPMVEKTITKSYGILNGWQNNGKIGFRQVDPLPFEITSMILDVFNGG